DHVLLVINTLLLLGVTFIPFPTAVIADYLGHPGELTAARFYAGTFVFTAIVFNLLWWYASSPRNRTYLLGVAPDHPEVRAIHAQYRLGPLIYGACFVLAFWSAHDSLF